MTSTSSASDDSCTTAPADGSGGGATAMATMRGLLAGPIAGVCSRLVTYPPDTIKARLQVQGAAAGPGAAVYRGTWHAAVQVTGTEGLRGFYRGFGAVLVGSVPGNLAYFGGYEAARQLLPADAGFAGDLAVGAAAQLVGGLVFTPVDIIKERMQVAPLMQRLQQAGAGGAAAAGGGAGGAPAGAYPSLSGPWQALVQLVRQNGPLGLLRGYWATNAVWLPWNTLYIALYESAKRAAPGAQRLLAARAQQGSGAGEQGAAGAGGAGGGSAGGDEAGREVGAAREELSPLVLGVCSAGSASVAALLTHPMDVVKTRLQVLTACQGSAGLTAWGLARNMWSREGPRVFMSGLSARLLQLAPGTALSWMVYEPVKRMLGGSG